jgi:hypothetical protein
MSTQYSTRRRASDGLPARDHHGGTHRPAEGGVGHADPPHARELLVSVLPVLLTPHHTRLTSRHVSRHATSGATHSIIHSELLPRSYLPRWNATLQPTPYTATISITPRITGPPPTPHRAPGTRTARESGRSPRSICTYVHGTRVGTGAIDCSLVGIPTSRRHELHQSGAWRCWGVRGRP